MPAIQCSGSGMVIPLSATSSEARYTCPVCDVSIVLERRLDNTARLVRHSRTVHGTPTRAVLDPNAGAFRVTASFFLCRDCGEGLGGECQNPGCIFFGNQGPQFPLLAQLRGLGATIVEGSTS